MNKNEKALVLLSGGQDSTTCLYWAKKQFKEVSALSIYYGQKHRREIANAESIARLAEVKQEVLILNSDTLEGGSLLDGTPIPEGLSNGIAPTFVPGRNLLFLVIAANRAYLAGIKHIVIGVSQTDYSGYPDCRLNTIYSMEQTLTLGFETRLQIHSPLMALSKAETVILAKSLPGCWEALAYTHTCYNNEFPPCGKCPACILRAMGFNNAGFPDPLLERWANGRD